MAEPALFPALDNGEIDMAFMWNYDLPSRFSWQNLGEVERVCIGSPRNRAFVERFDADYFNAALHVRTTTSGQDRTPLDAQLASAGHSRQTGLRTPYFLTTMSVVAKSDMMASIPDILAPVARDRFGLVVRPMPFDLPPRHLNLVWHKTRDADPLHGWMRQMVVESYWEMVEAG